MRLKIASAAVLALGVALPAATAAAAQSGTATACETAAATITIVKGSSQSAVVGSEFAQQLQVSVTDANNVAVPDCPVTMTVVPGGTGAGATIVANGRTSIVHHTSTNGSLREQLIANAHTGSFTVTVAVNNNTTAVPATFTETNLAAKASSSIVPSTIARGACAKFYYSVDTTSWNVISVYGARGKRLLLATLGTQTPGLHAWKWCGKTASGVQLPTGHFTIRLAARVGTSVTAPIVATTQQILTIT